MKLKEQNLISQLKEQAFLTKSALAQIEKLHYTLDKLKSEHNVDIEIIMKERDTFKINLEIKYEKIFNDKISQRL